jgi:hypothetical protein
MRSTISVGEHRPDPFPYEELLAFYRNRIEDAGRRAAIESLIAVDPRWQAHWDSVQYLDLEREVARRDGEALENFLDKPPTAFCCAVATTGGDILATYLDPLPGQSRLEGHSLDEWAEHVTGCVYCRRMQRRAHAVLQKTKAGLGVEERLLRDWLLEGYYQPQVEQVTRKLQPEPGEMLKRAHQQATAAGGEQPGVFRLVELDEALLDVLRESLSQSSGEMPSTLHRTIIESDPLYVIPAGGEETAVMTVTSPLWFTHLLAPPAKLFWQPGPADIRWKVRVWDPLGDEVLSEEVSIPEFELPATARAVIPRERDVRWEVLRIPSNGHGGPPDRVVRGVFRVVSEQAVADIESLLEKIGGAPLGLERELTRAACYFDHGLFEALCNHLRGLEEHYPSGAGGFLVQRALASLFVAVRRELTGRRRMGDPEGAWAAELAESHLFLAYLMLGVEYPGT